MAVAFTSFLCIVTMDGDARQNQKIILHHVGVYICGWGLFWLNSLKTGESGSALTMFWRRKVYKMITTAAIKRYIRCSELAHLPCRSTQQRLCFSCPSHCRRLYYVQEYSIRSHCQFNVV